MAQVKLYNIEGVEVGTVELNDAVFGIKVKDELIHQVYTAERANAREPWADTKDKSEVAGGGRKPWKQKGPGRARHGSIRSPIWKGGGVTFGPLTTRTYTQKINKKMNSAAVSMCLSDKVKAAHLFVIDALATEGKTQKLAVLRKTLGAAKTTLVVTNGKDEQVLRSARNIANMDVKRAEDLNIVDLLHHQFVIMSKDALPKVEERLTK